LAVQRDAGKRFDRTHSDWLSQNATVRTCGPIDWDANHFIWRQTGTLPALLNPRHPGSSTNPHLQKKSFLRLRRARALSHPCGRNGCWWVSVAMPQVRSGRSGRYARRAFTHSAQTGHFLSCSGVAHQRTHRISSSTMTILLAAARIMTVGATWLTARSIALIQIYWPMQAAYIS
jgi:hypothetical protein